METIADGLLSLFSRALSALPPEFPRVRTTGNLPDLTKLPPKELEDGNPKRRKRAKGRDGEATDRVLNATPLTAFDGKVNTSFSNIP